MSFAFRTWKDLPQHPHGFRKALLEASMETRRHWAERWSARAQQGLGAVPIVWMLLAEAAEAHTPEMRDRVVMRAWDVSEQFGSVLAAFVQASVELRQTIKLSRYCQCGSYLPAVLVDDEPSCPDCDAIRPE